MLDVAYIVNSTVGITFADFSQSSPLSLPISSFTGADVRARQYAAYQENCGGDLEYMTAAKPLTITGQIATGLRGVVAVI